MQVKSQPNEKGELRLTIDINPDELHLEYTLIGVVVYLKDFHTAGKPGSPALPQGTVRIALPSQAKLLDVHAEIRKSKLISSDKIPIAPQQPMRPGQEKDQDHTIYYRPNEEEQFYKHEKRIPLQDERLFSEPFPIPSFEPANSELYGEAVNYPSLNLIETLTEGFTPIAIVDLRPVHLTADGLLELVTQLDITLRYIPNHDDLTKQALSRFPSRTQAMRQIALTRLTVINPYEVFDFSDLYPIVYIAVDYLVITDNEKWNAQTIAPIGPAGGDLIASFTKLADWKRQRGIKARVVTITDIVADRYGNFRADSRDLQEVIRNFLKMAYANWGVTWVLLGGDTDIIPIRKVASDIEGTVSRQATTPPPANTSFWTGSYLQMHVVNPGLWWRADAENMLVRRDSGLLIPYDSIGISDTASRGWYFTTDNTFSVRRTLPTHFVRVNGPPNEVNADFQFLYNWNTIPTDLYYSSLVGQQYNFTGLHDWDLTDNGVYGQHSGTNIDGIDFTPTVSLGRVPVNNAASADAFVRKVIAYEKFQRPDGINLDANWTRKVILISDNWNFAGLLSIFSTTTNPPLDNEYNHPSGANYSLIKLETDHDWTWSLIAYVSPTDQRLIPYRTDANGGVRGWYFARSASDLSVNIRLIEIRPNVKLPLLEPSRWIVVYGTPEELIPDSYIFNAPGLDGSAADQEQLADQLRRDSGFSDIRRLYQDIVNLTPSQISAGPIEPISGTGVSNALNDGPHIVSLSGHGNSGGCCLLGHSTADNLTNGYHSFIVYADSCLTNQLDGNALSEHLVANANGGAVAYIGNTRFSWIGIGDDYQRRFFKQWSTLGGNAHLGLLADTRASLYNSNNGYFRWAMLSLNLVGDPEMPLWWHEPIKFRLPKIYVSKKIEILIDPNPPDPLSPIELPYHRNWGLTYVHISQGKQEVMVAVDATGRAEIEVDKLLSGEATLTMTRVGHQPFIQQIIINKSTGSKARGWMFAFAFLIGAITVSRALKRRY